MIQFDEHIFLVGLVQPPTRHILGGSNFHANPSVTSVEAIPPTSVLPTLDIKVPKSERIFGPGNNFWQMYGWNRCMAEMHSNPEQNVKLRSTWELGVCCFVTAWSRDTNRNIREQRTKHACLGKWLIDGNSYKYPLSKKFYCPIAPSQKDKQQKHTSLQKKELTRWFKPCPNFIPDRWRSLNFTPWVRVTFSLTIPKKVTAWITRPRIFPNTEKTWVFFFSKRCPFQPLPHPSRPWRRKGFGKGNQGGFFFGWFSKADLWSKRWPHLGGGNSNIFLFTLILGAMWSNLTSIFF